MSCIAIITLKIYIGVIPFIYSCFTNRNTERLHIITVK